LYADDVALFIKPLEEELNATMAILDAFEQAS
jgi:type IV secretory pathway VirB9-like protein